MLQNAYDCYTFSGDVTLLAKEIYSMMEECARLWTQLLIFDAKSGRMVSSPSFSPENGPVTAGDTYDQELVWQLYTDVLDAARVLAENGWEGLPDQALLETIRKQLPLLKPLQVGKWGQIKEWFFEDQWPDRGFKTKKCRTIIVICRICLASILAAISLRKRRNIGMPPVFLLRIGATAGPAGQKR